MYLLAYGRICANQGAMTPGASAETADGMSEAKIDAIIEAMRHERYRFAPARRVFIPRRTGNCVRSACRHGRMNWRIEADARLMRAGLSIELAGRTTGPVLLPGGLP